MHVPVKSLKIKGGPSKAWQHQVASAVAKARAQEECPLEAIDELAAADEENAKIINNLKLALARVQLLLEDTTHVMNQPDGPVAAKRVDGEQGKTKGRVDISRATAQAGEQVGEHES